MAWCDPVSFSRAANQRGGRNAVEERHLHVHQHQVEAGVLKQIDRLAGHCSRLLR